VWRRDKAGRCASSREPKIDFTKIPDGTPRRQIEAPRKLSTLLHLIDRGVGKRHEFAQLLTTDDGFGFDNFDGQGGKHDQSPLFGMAMFARARQSGIESETAGNGRKGIPHLCGERNIIVSEIAG
jgi:hypothetical protein